MQQSLELSKNKVLFQTHNRRLAEELATAESITAKDSNYVDTFSLDFAFSFAAYTLLARFIPITKIRNPLLKTLENAAKSRILLACADRRTRQCYLTICAILANYKEQVLLTSIKKNRYCTRYTKHYNFNIHVSLATDTLHLLLKGLLIAVVSLLFILKAPFALHFIRAVCNLVILAQYKSYDEDTLAYIQELIPGIQPYSTKLPLSEIAANIAISNFIHAAAILQAFKFYDLSTIICSVHLVLRNLPNLTTYTTMSYYVNNYIN
ncbi:hypothetical protein HBI65_201790 [Parastagonospora nodorum]|nr:hypothetical protein HBI65_201790 [Parastagonospora nodorum]